MYLGVGVNVVGDEVTTELLATASGLGTKAPVTGDGIWMCAGILIQILLLMDNYTHISNLKFILMGTIPGPPTTPSKGMGTTRTLEITITNVANAASVVNVRGSADAATGTQKHIQTANPLHNPILTPLNPTLSHTWPKKPPSSKTTNIPVTH